MDGQHITRLLASAKVFGFSSDFCTHCPRRACWADGQAQNDFRSSFRPKGNVMGKVVASASMSLDGYIAKEDNSIGRLFDWFDAGDVEIATATPDLTFHLTPESAQAWHRWTDELGAIVCGRTLFDFTDGWGGRHTMDIPVVVVTHDIPEDWIEAHPDAPFTFVPEGVKAAVEKAQMIAGERIVAVTGGVIASQCLDLGLLDEVAIDLVPVVMGGGRPFFGNLTPQDYPLGNPTTCVQSDRVIHLVFPVQR
jgi:dihydrofolate reductase